ncbi:nucleotidyltransferase domain-containing protein [Beijerinckia sp. L45]|uniref:nucleotidyltransferase domain-containing protein n=1 Tax=Beijerinckia sp. L45 TaxID=1641855 RepID=UPI00131DE672|nr:nucleotidyltransferase domain-containing protein [Beijerinckia sp. L45]
MPTILSDDLILRRFRADLDQAYGARIERVVLFGSRARGDARPDSDYDIAVFFKDVFDLHAEVVRLADLETAILFDTGAVINALPFRAEAYQRRSGLMPELRKDGRDL